MVDERLGSSLRLTGLTVPTVIVLYCYLFFRVAPALLLQSSRARDYARVIAMVLVTISVVRVGVKQVEEHIWLVTFMHYDLGYFDDETCRLEPIDNPFGPKLLPMSPE